MPAYPQGGGLTGGRLLVAAGEASGDRLLAELVAELRARRPDVEVRGVVGALARAAGVSPIADADALTVIGFKGVPAAHVPLWQVSWPLQTSLSSQAVPSLRFVHADVLVAGVHTWQPLITPLE